jgi:hypothetical protein
MLEAPQGRLRPKMGGADGLGVRARRTPAQGNTRYQIRWVGFT